MLVICEPKQTLPSLKLLLPGIWSQAVSHVILWPYGLLSTRIRVTPLLYQSMYKGNRYILIMEEITVNISTLWCLS